MGITSGRGHRRRLCRCSPGAEAGYGPEDQYSDTDPSALTDFRSTLEPYGQWTDDPTYGTVWSPPRRTSWARRLHPVRVGRPLDVADDDYTWVRRTTTGAGLRSTTGAGCTPRPTVGGWIPGLHLLPEPGSPGRYEPYVETGATSAGKSHGTDLGLAGRRGDGARVHASCAIWVRGPRRSLRGRRPARATRRRRPARRRRFSFTRPYASGASPSVGGRVTATPHVGGPPPSVLGIPLLGHRSRRSTTNCGVMQAQAFAHASTATAMGAHAPSAVASRGVGSASGLRGGLSGAGAYGREPSHFGGRLGGGFVGARSTCVPALRVDGARVLTTVDHPLRAAMAAGDSGGGFTVATAAITAVGMGAARLTPVRRRAAVVITRTRKRAAAAQAITAVAAATTAVGGGYHGGGGGWAAAVVVGAVAAEAMLR